MALVTARRRLSSGFSSHSGEPFSVTSQPPRSRGRAVCLRDTPVRLGRWFARLTTAAIATKRLDPLKRKDGSRWWLRQVAGHCGSGANLADLVSRIATRHVEIVLLRAQRKSYPKNYTGDSSPTERSRGLFFTRMQRIFEFMMWMRRLR